MSHLLKNLNSKPLGSLRVPFVFIKEYIMIGTVELSIDDYNSLINDRRELLEARQGNMYKLVYIGVTCVPDDGSPKFVDKLQRKVHIEHNSSTLLYRLHVLKYRHADQIKKLKNRNIIERIFNTN